MSLTSISAPVLASVSRSYLGVADAQEARRLDQSNQRGGEEHLHDRHIALFALKGFGEGLGIVQADALLGGCARVSDSGKCARDGGRLTDTKGGVVLVEGDEVHGRLRHVDELAAWWSSGAGRRGKLSGGIATGAAGGGESS